MKLFSLLGAVALVAVTFSNVKADIIVSYDFMDDANIESQSGGDLVGAGSDIVIGPFTDGAVDANFPTTGFSGASDGPFARTNAVGEANEDGDSLADAITIGSYFGFTVTNNSSDSYQLDQFTHSYGFSSGFPTVDAFSYVLSDVSGFADGSELGTHQIAVADTGFNQNIAQTDRVTDLTSLGVLAPSESVEIRVYLSDGSTSGNRIHRLGNFILEGTIVAVPEPSSAVLLGLSGLALLIRRRS